MRNRRKLAQVLTVVRSRTFIGVTLFVSASALILAHGFAGSNFRVDEITLGLLVIASLPFISTMVTSVKAGGVEMAFRDLSVHDQLVLFLDGVATKGRWTFFSPRPGESNLGPAFAVLTEELLKGARGRLVVQLRQWLASDDLHQRWFAAEIVGYHQLHELRRAVQRAPEATDLHAPWEPWELNCIWAYSRLQEQPYERLRAFLNTTTNVENQTWVLKSYDQMIEAGLETAEMFAPTVRAFVEKHGHDLVEPLKYLRPCLSPSQDRADVQLSTLAETAK